MITLKEICELRKQIPMWKAKRDTLQSEIDQSKATIQSTKESLDKLKGEKGSLEKWDARSAMKPFKDQARLAIADYKEEIQAQRERLLKCEKEINGEIQTIIQTLHGLETDNRAISEWFGTLQREKKKVCDINPHLLNQNSNHAKTLNTKINQTKDQLTIANNRLSDLKKEKESLPDEERKLLLRVCRKAKTTRQKIKEDYAKRLMHCIRFIDKAVQKIAELEELIDLKEKESKTLTGNRIDAEIKDIGCKLADRKDNPPFMTWNLQIGQNGLSWDLVQAKDLILGCFIVFFQEVTCKSYRDILCHFAQYYHIFPNEETFKERAGHRRYFFVTMVAKEVWETPETSSTVEIQNINNGGGHIGYSVQFDRLLLVNIHLQRDVLKHNGIGYHNNVNQRQLQTNAIAQECQNIQGVKRTYLGGDFNCDSKEAPKLITRYLTNLTILDTNGNKTYDYKCSDVLKEEIKDYLAMSLQSNHQSHVCVMKRPTDSKNLGVHYPVFFDDAGETK